MTGQLQSIGLMHQFHSHSQHCSHPAEYSHPSNDHHRQHTPATDQHMTFCEEFCMTSQHSILPHPPSSRIVTLVWTPSSTLSVTSFMDDPIALLIKSECLHYILVHFHFRKLNCKVRIWLQCRKFDAKILRINWISQYHHERFWRN